jgi:Single-strand binding protein family
MHPRPSVARSLFENPLRASARCGLLPQSKFGSSSADYVQSPREWVATAHPLGKHVPQTADKLKEMEPNSMFNKVILIGRLGQNAEAKTAQNNCEYVVLNIATQESWKNDKGDYETRTE